MRSFRLNPRLNTLLRRHGDYPAALEQHAERARQAAEQLATQAQAPWMPRRGTTGTGTFNVETDGDEVRLVNTDHAGHLVEFGSRNNPPHAPLRRGVQAAGLRLDET